MAISASRLEQLRQEFIPVKNQIDKIDRKYSLDYVEPLLDMPQSLDLPRLTYTPKTEQQLSTLANQNTYASYVSNLNRLANTKASNLRRIDKQLLALEEKNRATLAKLLSEHDRELDNVNNKMINAGLMFSTVIERVKSDIRKDYERKVAQSNASADNDRNALQAEREQIEADYAEALAGAEAQRQAKIQAEYIRLLKAEQAEQTRVAKYNAQLDEKEKKYLMSRAKALESAKQAEYNRAYAAKKLYQQMGAVGYEEAVLWEKYNVFTKHFSSFTKREEALALVQGDAYVQGHLKQYYSTLLDWINRNVPV